MKNRRNTRRGRARRWKFVPQMGVVYWLCKLGRWDHMSVQLFPGRANPWLPLLNRRTRCVAGKMQSSRAAAMRCADALDRLSRDQCRRQRKDGFALAA